MNYIYVWSSFRIAQVSIIDRADRTSHRQLAVIDWLIDWLIDWVSEWFANSIRALSAAVRGRVTDANSSQVDEPAQALMAWADVRLVSTTSASSRLQLAYLNNSINTDTHVKRRPLQLPACVRYQDENKFPLNCSALVQQI